jgi:AraC-like DNA-binding protein
MSSEGRPTYDRVLERRRVVALAHHFREAEGLSIAQIAERLGRSPATVKAYFYDPTGERHGRSKHDTWGIAGAAAPIRSRATARATPTHCKRCHPGAIPRRWTRERVLDAMCDWRTRYGRLPSSYDWSMTHARRRGGEARRRLESGGWPSASVVTTVWGSWGTARLAAEDQTLVVRDTAGQNLLAACARETAEVIPGPATAQAVGV